MFDSIYPRISYNLFKEYDWFNLNRDSTEDINTNISESRGHKVFISMFVDAELAGEKSNRRRYTGVLDICE